MNPSEEEKAALDIIFIEHWNDEKDFDPYTTAESMKDAILKAFRLGTGRGCEHGPSD